MKFIKSFIILLSGLFILLGCNTNDNNGETIEGIWQGVENEKLLEIKSGKYQFYDVSGTSCNSSEEGDVSEISNKACLKNGILTISIGRNHFKYKRIDNLPSGCRNDIEDQKLEPLLTASL